MKKVKFTNKVTSNDLEKTISALEEGVGAAMFSSGMAAISSILSLLCKEV